MSDRNYFLYKYKKKEMKKEILLRKNSLKNTWCKYILVYSCLFKNVRPDYNNILMIRTRLFYCVGLPTLFHYRQVLNIQLCHIVIKRGMQYKYSLILTYSGKRPKFDAHVNNYYLSIASMSDF